MVTVYVCTQDLPNLRQIVLIQPTLPKHLKSSLPRDKTLVASVPCAENLIIALLLSLRQSPGNPWCCSTTLLIVLLKRLLQRYALRLLELRRACEIVRHRWVRGQKSARHHLQPWVDKPSSLRQQRRHSTIAGGLPDKWPWRRTQKATRVLLRAQEPAAPKVARLELGGNGGYRGWWWRSAPLERTRLEPSRLRLKWWLLKPSLLRLEAGGLHPKPTLLRLLRARVARWLRLLEAERSLTWKARLLRGDATWLKPCLELLLLLSWIKSSLQGDLIPLAPLCHFYYGEFEDDDDGNDEDEMGMRTRNKILDAEAVESAAELHHAVSRYGLHSDWTEKYVVFQGYYWEVHG